MNEASPISNLPQYTVIPGDMLQHPASSFPDGPPPSYNNHNASAAQQVFSNWELTQAIFLRLPCPSGMVLQRINATSHNIVRTSIRVRRTLFLAPDTFNTTPRLNPLLTHIFNPRKVQIRTRFTHDPTGSSYLGPADLDTNRFDQV